MKKAGLLILVIVCYVAPLLAQEKDTLTNGAISTQYLAAVSKKASTLNQQLDKKSEKALAKLQKQEAKMQRMLNKIC